ncbi:hypothetical protein PWG15_24660 (plasmid) [Ensifer adhaerens]|uniref:hypothetical protein n=1 Tax=Ensifer adhaerens TaxID=106592 RepID=UPI0023A9AEE7|nr:hypothetical protein [Ensifer adhaerens]WDZ80947.1 hypothetical protein PWG15_24660 [Ensifer adhaerens]
MRVVGMDIHRSFAQVAILDNGSIVSERRVELVRDRFLRFAASLRGDDEVVIEATGNSTAVERLLRPYVKRVIVANSPSREGHRLGSGQVRQS